MDKKKDFDSKLISSLLLAAKGPRRTSADFCKECDISTPTFSRYINGKNKRPCPVEILKKVAAHADPDSNVTYEKLIAANGECEVYAFGSKAELLPNEYIGIIAGTLLHKHYKCQYPDNITSTDIIGLHFSPSWSILTDAVMEATQKVWSFIFWKELADITTEAERFSRQLLMMIAVIHLNYASFDKLTFAFTNTELYEEIIRRINSLTIDSWISLLLIDPVTKKITSEHLIPNSVANTPLDIFSTNNSVDLPESSLLNVDTNNLL